MGNSLMSKFLTDFSHFLSSFTSRFNLTSHAIMAPIKTFVFLDLETTGLPWMEHNKTKVTEFSAISVQADHIELGCFPRVHNKLNFCFNPGKFISPESTDLTGLSNELLANQSGFSNDTVEIISKWLETNQKPVCFVAHNGNRFDYPILRAEIEKAGGSLPDHVLCIDSLPAFRHMDRQARESSENEDDTIIEATQRRLSPEEVQKLNETTPKKQMIPSSSQIESNGAVRRNLGGANHPTTYKLEDIYERLTGKKASCAHQAESDVIMLTTCAAVYGEKFVEYANLNCVYFSDMPVMKPGKKIGT